MLNGPHFWAREPFPPPPPSPQDRPKHSLITHTPLRRASRRSLAGWLFSEPQVAMKCDVESLVVTKPRWTEPSTGKTRFHQEHGAGAGGRRGGGRAGSQTHVLGEGTLEAEHRARQTSPIRHSREGREQCFHKLVATRSKLLI